MRKFILLIVVAGFVYVSVAQKLKIETKTTKVKTEQGILKDHVCNGDCKNGMHKLMHGEKGHTCRAECKKKK